MTSIQYLKWPTVNLQNPRSRYILTWKRLTKTNEFNLTSLTFFLVIEGRYSWKHRLVVQRSDKSNLHDVKRKCLLTVSKETLSEPSWPTFSKTSSLIKRRTVHVGVRSMVSAMIFFVLLIENEKMWKWKIFSSTC